jgi:tetraprenyl-beta-curcumene synthase
MSNTVAHQVNSGVEIVRIGRFIFRTRIQVERELNYWRSLVDLAPDPDLKNQALRSISLKKFHALGGCIYATRYPKWGPVLIPLIVAIQTISDYLDNLCDRMQLTDSASFRTLHLAFLDALNPNQPIKDYYFQYPHQKDGDYLASLVAYSQQQIRLLPGLAVIQEPILRLASLYCDLQVYKHMDLDLRGSMLQKWAEVNSTNFPELKWWEFSAASGSTLAIFALLAAATNPQLSAGDCQKILNCYFPWICGLHILLDYYIDQQEDQIEGDLNFVSYYADATQTEQRLNWFIGKSQENARKLPDARFHNTVVKGLPALYLSDPKITDQNLAASANRILTAAGRGSSNLFHLCRAMRRLKLV